jgi:SAM-dependent methyltransferase
MEDYSSWAGRDERVFEYLPLERELLQALGPGATILDLGCGDGSHMPILAGGGAVVGADAFVPGLSRASRHGIVVGAEGERLPFRSEAFDLVYISHVLHHATEPRAVLTEVGRVLKPGGGLLVIETCEDSPLMRLARTLRPEWESVPVRSRFRYARLVSDVRQCGFTVRATRQFNVLYWTWGFARRIIRPLERLVDVVIRVELRAVRRWRRYSAYGYVVATKQMR